MEPTYTPNGDVELGDYHARMSDDWVNIVWLITKYCNLGCPYCVGFKLKGQYPKSLLDEHEPEALADMFARVGRDNGRKVYLTISGGEPTYVPRFDELCHHLTTKGVTIELQTNLTLPAETLRWLESVDPRYVGQVMASFHRWAHKTQPHLPTIYADLFRTITQQGILAICKIMVMPGHVRHFFEEEEPSARSILPGGALILPWNYIARAPKSKASPQVSESGHPCYPYGYSEEDHALLDEHVKIRATEQRMFRRGGGWFQGMRCDAGNGFVFMDEFGRAFRCFGASSSAGGTGMGTLQTGVKLETKPRPCPWAYCGTPFWGIWFGENPWAYIDGAKREDFWCNKYGPGRKI